MSVKPMTPYQRVITALRGEEPDRVPFTVYSQMIPQCTVERELRNRGLCIVYRIRSYSMHYPNVKIEAHHYTDEKERQVIRTVYQTPHGTLSTLVQPAGFTSWTHERMFKTEEDYKALLFLIKDTVVKPDYSTAIKTVTDLGEDFIVRDNMPLEPLQALISNYMDTETFCMEWMDNRDEVLKLYEALVDVNRKTYPLVADGPLEFANYGGNVVPQIVGVENFRKYYVPHYNEAAEVLHKKGKLIGCHLDADNSLIMGDVAETDLDYIEAYDPGISPSLNIARKAWPEKTIWINWPSAWHLDTEDEVCCKTVGLIEDSSRKKGFIIGITENLPEDRWRKNFTAIMDGIDKYTLNLVNQTSYSRLIE